MIYGTQRLILLFAVPNSVSDRVNMHQIAPLFSKLEI